MTEKALAETTILAIDLANDKKWKWLQEQNLSFIDDRQEFYQLIEYLSNLKGIKDAECQNIIKKIRITDYEAFVLKLHELTCEAVPKRSQWFVGDKVSVYKHIVKILFNIDSTNKYEILAKIVEKCFKKIPLVGPTSRKLGDEILSLFYNSGTIEGLGTLLKLRSRNKYPVFLEELERAISLAAHHSNLNPNDIEDYFITDYGLIDGILEREFGEYKSEVKISAYDDIKVIWTNAKKVLKSEPATVKADFESDLKVWKSTIKDIKKEISGHKIRFESFWKKKKKWNFNVWREHFFDHQLLGFISQKLIWRFEKNGEIKNAYFFNEQFVDCYGNIVENIENSIVTLWHPVLSNIEEVQEWRNFILLNEIKQPFKQAFREIYIVTEAEVNTSIFSNRFNNHVLRHHKLIALAQQRLWQYSHSDLYSGGENPSIFYPDFNIKCTLEIRNDYDFATTGQVDFRDTVNNTVLRMEDVPSLIFSEAMRDIDLFVSLCSIGIEEQWENQHFRGYWTDYSKSNLSATAEMRRSVVQSIIAKLKIKDQCEVSEKYLKVTGKKRVYKIHFASGNVLMEPNDQYLCIIPDPKAALEDKLFLPFSDDLTLSIIISKALLLVDDDKITDFVILNQINRK